MTSDWKSELDNMFQQKEEQNKAEKIENENKQEIVEKYIESILLPACEELKAYFDSKGKETSIYKGAENVTISVSSNNGKLELSMNFKVGSSLGPIYIYPENTFLDKKDGKRYTSRGGSIQGKTDDKNPSKEAIIKHFVNEYRFFYTYPE